MAILKNEEFEQIGKILTDDLHEIMKLRGHLRDPILRRVYIRSLFTSFEGRLFTLKQFMLSLENSLVWWNFPVGKGRMNLFTEEERAMLEEISFRMTSGGDAEKVTYFARFADSFKFAIKLLHKIMELESNVDFGGSGWAALMEIQKVRNRLTHPRAPLDLEVSNQELKFADQAADWFESTYGSVLARLYTESRYAHRFEPEESSQSKDSV